MMKKLTLLFVALFIGFCALGQNTVTLESGTSGFTPQFRYKAVTPDSVSHWWLYNPLTAKYNRIFTGTESGLRYVPYTGAITDFTTKHKVSFESTVTGLTTHSFIDPGTGGYLWLIDEITGDVTEFQGNRIYDFNNGSRIPYLKQGEAAPVSGSTNYIINGASPQTASFNITGNGTFGGSINLPDMQLTGNGSQGTIMALKKNGIAINDNFGNTVARFNGIDPASDALGNFFYTKTNLQYTLGSNADAVPTILTRANGGSEHGEIRAITSPALANIIAKDTAVSKNYVLNLRNLTSLQTYTGAATSVFVNDSLRGGSFNYIASGLAPDSGTVFISANGGYWKRNYSQATGLNVRWFGAKGDGVTDDGLPIQQAVKVARSLGQMLNFIKTSTYYFTTLTNSLGNNIRIEGNGATIKCVPTNLSVKSLFSIDSTVTTSNISIHGLNLLAGGTEVKFIVSRTGTGVTPSPRYVINSISITDCTAGNNPITIDFNPTYIELRNITLGLGITSTDAANPALTVSNDPTFTTGESLIVDNVTLYRGNKDGDMFFIKGGSYQDVRMTNLTANSLAYISGGTGDGFDTDNLGKNVIMNNIKAIQCSIEIKTGVTVFGTYNLNASNLTCIHPANSGISIRASGIYSNILVSDPFATGLNVSGYLPVDGSSANDAYINISNYQVSNAGSKSSATPMIAVGLNNINMFNGSIFNEFGVTTNYASGIRFGTARNVNISNLQIKNAGSAFLTGSGSELNNINVNGLNTISASAKEFSFSSDSVNNITVTNWRSENFTGSAPWGLGTSIFTNARFYNIPADRTASLVALTAFTAVSQNFLLNNTVYDKVVASGATPTINTLFPIGNFITNVADGTLWFRKTSAAITKYLSTVSLTTDVTGVLPIANGGHGIGTAPALGQIPIATSTTVYTPTTVSGDLTNSAGAFTIGSNKVTYAKMQAMTANRLLGSGASGTAVSEITLGTGLSFTGSTLNAAGGSVTSVTSANSDIGIATGTTTPVLTFNKGVTGLTNYYTQTASDARYPVSTFGSLATNDMLTYNGTNWQNEKNTYKLPLYRIAGENFIDTTSSGVSTRSYLNQYGKLNVTNRWSNLNSWGVNVGTGISLNLFPSVSGSLLVTQNYTNGGGETDFFSNYGSSATVGGFDWYSYTNAGTATFLMRLNATSKALTTAGTIAPGTINHSSATNNSFSQFNQTTKELESRTNAEVKSDLNILPYSGLPDNFDLLSFDGTNFVPYKSYNIIDNVTTKTADYTISASDFLSGNKATLDLYVDATSANITITLPPANTFKGYTIYVTKTDGGINTITINTVTGANTLIAKDNMRQFNSDGTVWRNH